MQTLEDLNLALVMLYTKMKKSVTEKKEGVGGRRGWGGQITCMEMQHIGMYLVNRTKMTVFLR